ncbi:hypothetical protein FNV43_RR06737 [Rhamnella rubrinervis]|uniref:Uncharacterized protein n=1 Tax=Rhamnella rubrinervis TaxID=2594499 RepID=A0A8K0HEH3_9ROSA|nr:hypothetical protein FNV43_RR06737 [Rhamnella rubrinervis]
MDRWAGNTMLETRVQRKPTGTTSIYDKAIGAGGKIIRVEVLREGATKVKRVWNPQLHWQFRDYPRVPYEKSARASAAWVGRISRPLTLRLPNTLAPKERGETPTTWLFIFGGGENTRGMERNLYGFRKKQHVAITHTEARQMIYFCERRDSVTALKKMKILGVSATGYPNGVSTRH